MTTNLIYRIGVWYVVDPEKNGFVFFGDVEGDQNDPVIEVAAGVQMINFSLNTAIFLVPVSMENVTLERLEEHQADPEDQANFTTNPIQWVNSLSLPIDTPVEIQIQRFNGSNFQVVDYNGTASKDTLSLRLLVMHRGKIDWSPDPTIINMPPDPPGGGPSVQL